MPHACPESRELQIEIVGSEGSIIWDSGEEESISASRVDMFDKVIDYLNGSNDLVCDLNIAYSLTELINAMHSSTQIQDIPETEYSVVSGEAGDQYCLDNIESIIQEAVEKELLPSEFHIPWAVKTEAMDCKDLDSFPKSI